MGIANLDRKYDLTDLASGDVIVAATGVTDGALLRGVRFRPDRIQTETLVYRSEAGTVRRILGEHRRGVWAERGDRAPRTHPDRACLHAAFGAQSSAHRLSTTTLVPTLTRLNRSIAS